MQRTVDKNHSVQSISVIDCTLATMRNNDGIDELLLTTAGVALSKLIFLAVKPVTRNSIIFFTGADEVASIVAGRSMGWADT